MEDTGRPTILTDDLFGKLRDSVFAGKSLKDFANENGISPDTVYDWSYKNYLGFSDKVENWERDRKLMLAEKNILDFVQLNDEIEIVVGKGDNRRVIKGRDSRLTKIKADMSVFVAETLGKDKGYSKRSELTGKGGAPLGLTALFDEANKKE